MKKIAQVHVLDTLSSRIHLVFKGELEEDGKGNLSPIKNERLLYVEQYSKHGYPPKQICLTTDEEISVGDLILDLERGTIGTCINSEESDYLNSTDNSFRKIIATSDYELSNDPYPKDPVVFGWYKWQAACLSEDFIEQFIEEYNKGNIIKEVRVKYKKEDSSKLKFKKGNTCIVSFINEKTYTKSEMIKAASDFHLFYLNQNENIEETAEGWVNENY